MRTQFIRNRTVDNEQKISLTGLKAEEWIKKKCALNQLLIIIIITKSEQGIEEEEEEYGPRAERWERCFIKFSNLIRYCVQCSAFSSFSFYIEFLKDADFFRLYRCFFSSVHGPGFVRVTQSINSFNCYRSVFFVLSIALFSVELFFLFSIQRMRCLSFFFILSFWSNGIQMFNVQPYQWVLGNGLSLSFYSLKEIEYPFSIFKRMV